MTTSCSHVGAVRDDWPPVAQPTCEKCVASGSTWVSLRRCLSCGHVGCCDSSPNRHSTGHHQRTGHPVIRALEPGHDWVWCFVDEVSMRRDEGGWHEVDLFYDVGLTFMAEHLASGGSADLRPDAMVGKGFPLGEWIAELQRRHAAGELSPDQQTQLEAFPGWRWDG